MTIVDAALTSADALIGDSAIPYALFYSANRNVGGIIFDVTVREVHTDEYTITVHPVEGGTPISDHTFANPQIIEIQAGSSDSSGGYTGYVQDVYQALLALAATRQVFDVSTGKRPYTNMLFGNITVQTDATSEYALMVTARLQQVIMTDTSGSGTSLSNQTYPSQTGSSTDVGTQSLKSTTGTSSYGDYLNQFQPVG